MKAMYRSILVTGLLLLCGASWGQQLHVDLVEQPMGQALKALAQQTGLQVLFSADEVPADLRAPRIVGTYTADEVFSELLAGSSLRHRFINPRTVSIRAQQAAQTGAVTEVENPAALQLAQSEVESGQSAGGPSAPVALNPDASREAGASAKESANEITVTGSLIRGVENSTIPSTVLDRAYIDASGVGTVTALIESLPQNFALANQSGVLLPGVTNGKGQGSSINLRGIGEGTTLVLLNGKRMASGYTGAAVDISSLPLSAIERVEILTDGASALYGSDAVGGVVNFILRRDFIGAQTRLRSAWADQVDEYRVSQALGTAWSSGSGLLSMEFYRRGLLPSEERDFVPATSIIGSLLPRDKNYSALFSGQQRLFDGVEASTDLMYVKRSSFNEGGPVSVNENYTTENPQLFSNLALDWNLPGDWQLETSGGLARHTQNQIQRRNQTVFLTVDSRFDVRSARAKLDGTVFQLHGMPVRAALGSDWRKESLRFKNSNGSAGNFDQNVRSAFTELSIPLAGEGWRVRGIDRMELSLAGRFDDYSSFESSFDPRVGLMWQPIEGVRMRASYGTSYVAPKLLDYDVSLNSASSRVGADAGAPGGTSRILTVTGANADGYQPQDSTNISFGIDLTPAALPGFKLGLNYYDIEYRNKIATPTSATVILANPASYGNLFIRTPTAALVNQYVAYGQPGSGLFVDGIRCAVGCNFDPASIAVIVDRRRTNLSVLETHGFDISVDYAFDISSTALQLGIDATRISELVQRVTATSVPLDVVDTIYNPSDWRVRASLGMQRGAWSANMFVNHQDGYADNRRPVLVAVSSYLTVDARLAYEFSARQVKNWLSGVTVAVSAANLFDEDPPRVDVIDLSTDMGFDPTHASPLGRQVAIELTKEWGRR